MSNTISLTFEWGSYEDHFSTIDNKMKEYGFELMVETRSEPFCLCCSDYICTYINNKLTIDQYNTIALDINKFLNDITDNVWMTHPDLELSEI